MKKVSSGGQLHTVKFDAESYVLLGRLESSLVSLFVPVAFAQVLQWTKHCTRGTANDNEWLRVAYQLPYAFPYFWFAEIPRHVRSRVVPREVEAPARF